MQARPDDGGGLVPAGRSRSEEIRSQREDQGRRSLAVLPIHYPKELLTALDILAVEMWGPPGAPRGDAAGRLQTYVCAVVRNAMAFLASGQADAVDGALFPHTCDSLQGLATEAIDFGAFGKKAFVFQHPRGAERASAQRFLEAEMRSLAHELEEWTGTRLTEERLRRALEVHDEIDVHRAALLDGRARLPLSDSQLYGLLRRGEWLWPGEHLLELRAAVGRIESGPVQRGVPILVTGYVPEPPGLLETLHGAGAFVAADDYAAIGRRIARRSAEPSADPWADLVARYLSHPPCPTRGTDQETRMRHLVALAERGGARGVLIHVQKFCEPELFDVPAIQRTFAARGLPVLVLEGELERELSGQTETRIEAFVELLSSAGRAA